MDKKKLVKIRIDKILLIYLSGILCLAQRAYSQIGATFIKLKVITKSTNGEITLCFEAKGSFKKDVASGTVQRGECRKKKRRDVGGVRRARRRERPVAASRRSPGLGDDARSGLRIPRRRRCRRDSERRQYGRMAERALSADTHDMMTPSSPLGIFSAKRQGQLSGCLVITQHTALWKGLNKPTVCLNQCSDHHYLCQEVAIQS